MRTDDISLDKTLRGRLFSFDHVDPSVKRWRSRLTGNPFMTAKLQECSTGMQGVGRRTAHVARA